MKSQTIWMAKFLVSTGLLFTILAVVSPERALVILKASDPLFLFLACIVINGRVLIFGRRWKILLENYNFPVSTKLTTEIHFVGIFFNNFFLGSIGGDIVRGLAIKNYNIPISVAISTIIIERVYGVLSLCAIALTAYCLLYQSSPESIPIFFNKILISTLTLTILVSPLFIIYREQFFKLFDKINFRLRQGINKNIFATFAYSIAIHVLGIIAIYCLGMAVGSTISIYYYFVLCPIVNIISMAPISLNGLGVREASFVFLFSLIGMDSSQAASIAFLWLLLFYSQCIFGFYFLQKLDIFRLLKNDRNNK